MTPPVSSRLRSRLVIHRVFISYCHDDDQNYYNKFSRIFDRDYKVITDNSLEREVDSENVQYVIRIIREKHIRRSSCTLVLVGKNTWGRKYVDWEIKGTLDMEHGLIGVKLPARNRNRIPDRLLDNIRSGYALCVPWRLIMAGPVECNRYIDTAKKRPSCLINNSRDLRRRNA